MSSKLSGKDIQNSFANPSAFGESRESKVVRVDFPQICKARNKNMKKKKIWVHPEGCNNGFNVMGHFFFTVKIEQRDQQRNLLKGPSFFSLPFPQKK